MEDKIMGPDKHASNMALYACLPFVELAHQSVIKLGPVIFWSASRAEEFLQPGLYSSFQEYMKIAGEFKAQGADPGNQVITTGHLSLEGTTCVSIAEDVPVNLREYLLIDALYLLFFACTFRSLYYGQDIPPFNAFRKMIPASEEFIKNTENWKNLFLHETDREETVCLHNVDLEISEALGKALEGIYGSVPSSDPEKINAYKRLVRSIRYVVDRFFQRFVNLFRTGLVLSGEIFEPEDVIFLSSGFESLFNIDSSQETAADFKHKLRPQLHLKYSRPVEIFWKWVDDFYDVKKRIIHGDSLLDPMFKVNPNFEVSHILLGIKLFVYSVYYYLFKYQLIQSIRVDPYTPPDFKAIHPEELLLFFWTEPSVLEKISLFIQQSQKEPLSAEALADLNLLTTLFVSLYDRYYLSEQLRKQGVVRFIPSPLKEILPKGTMILEKLREMIMKDPNSIFLKNIHPYFVNVLEDRLQEKKI